MTTSKTDICNLALDLLSAEIVTNIDQPTTAQESLLARWYDISRRKILRCHTWNFATRRIILAASSTAPTFGYSAAWPLPTDFIRLVRLETEDGIPIATSEYQLEDNQILYSGTGSVRLVYIYDFENVSLMDPLYIELVAMDIALNIAFKVTDNATTVQRIEQRLKDRMPTAKSIDGQERPPERVQRSRALSARRFGFSNRTDLVDG